MTTMFFAGIPLEGSGVRPLEADLYGAEQQGVDHENLAGTGNLNVGVVADYDEHAQHFLNGSLKGDSEGPGSFTGTARYIPSVLPTFESAGYHGSNFGGDNGNILQTANQTTPSSQNIELPTHADNGSNAISSYSNGAQSEKEASSRHSVATEAGDNYSEGNYESHSSSSENTYNNYETNINNTTNNDYNYTQNNYYTSENNGNTYNEGGHDGSGGEHCGPGGNGEITIFNSFITNELNFVNTLTNETITNINQTVNNTDTIITDLMGGVGGVLNTVNIALDTAGSSVTQILNVVDGVENTTNGLLLQIADTTNSTLGSVTTSLNGLETTTGGLLTEILNTATNTVDHLSDTLGGVGGTLLSVTSPVTGIAGTLLSGNTIDLLSHDVGSIAVPVANNTLDLTADILNVTGNTLSAPINILDGNSVSPGSLSGEIGNTVHDITQSGGDLIHGVPGAAGNAVSALNLPPILDANVSVLTQGVSQASGALINVTGSVLSENSSSQQAGTSGLINVDTSLLSTGSSGHDGLSLSANPEALASLVPASGNISVVPEITVPLPTSANSVPIVSQVASAVTDIGSTVHDHTGNALDPIATLSALSQTSSVAAVDGGVLFTGATASVGHDSSTSNTSSPDILHNTGSLVHSLVHGLH